MAHDNCDSCGEDYDFDYEKDVVVVYLVPTSKYNHVQAQCPHCEVYTRIYCEPDVLVHLLSECELRVVLYDTVHEEVAYGYDVLEEVPDELPEAPHPWVRELYDDLRKWGETGES